MTRKCWQRCEYGWKQNAPGPLTCNVPEWLQVKNDIVVFLQFKRGGGTYGGGNVMRLHLMIWHEVSGRKQSWPCDCVFVIAWSAWHSLSKMLWKLLTSLKSCVISQRVVQRSSVSTDNTSQLSPDYKCVLLSNCLFCIFIVEEWIAVDEHNVKQIMSRARAVRPLFFESVCKWKGDATWQVVNVKVRLKWNRWWGLGSANSI